jgi:hypothetical protein
MNAKIFSGNIFIFHAFDVGDDVTLEKIRREHPFVECTATPYSPLTPTGDVISKDPQGSISLGSSKAAKTKRLSCSLTTQPKYFKNYHIPLAVTFSDPLQSPQCTSIKIHNFGVISLRYKIPFSSTMDDLRAQLDTIDRLYNKQSIQDVQMIFDAIKDHVKQAKFFHLRESYILIQVNSSTEINNIIDLKNNYGSTIASMLRFETESLSDFQKNDIIESAFGYYRGDLIIVDTQAAFLYDDEYEESLDIFEFGNIQQLELHYFDRVLDKQLNHVYERETKAPAFTAYLPFVGASNSGPIGDLSKLKVDISVITERLENSIKLAGEEYYSELYALLVKKLDIDNWKESINRKLSIIETISNVYQHTVDSIRGDILSIAVIVLVFGEFVMGILQVLRQ